MLAQVKEGKIKHWQVDLNFKKEQERLKIPADPEQWYDLFLDIEFTR